MLQGVVCTMPASYLLLSHLAPATGSAGALAIRGDDVYAVIGLIAGMLLLTIWVLLENLRLTRWRPGRARPDEQAGQGVQDSAPNHDALSQPHAHAVADADMASMAPVPARVEWLLDDNTLVRTGAVRRGAVRAAAATASGASPTETASVSPGAPIAPGAPRPRMKAKRPLHIAMMGSRGIPASYSGFETCVEQLSVRLVERGH